MQKSVLGIHHLTAIAGDPQRNFDFYTGLLGQRLVKQTVNFDDPGTYHLYYGDEMGHPGTILTFFPWSNAPKGRKGTGQVSEIAFAIPATALERMQAQLLISPSFIFVSGQHIYHKPVLTMSRLPLPT